MTSNLTTKLAEALAMNEERLSTIIRQTNWNGPLQCDGFARGMRSTHDSLQPLHKLLVEAVGALEGVMQLIDDADLVRNTCSDSDIMKFLAQGQKIIEPLKKGSETLQAIRTQLSKEGV